MSEWSNIQRRQNDICCRSETQSNDLSEKSKGRKSWLWNSKAGPFREWVKREVHMTLSTRTSPASPRSRRRTSSPRPAGLLWYSVSLTRIVGAVSTGGNAGTEWERTTSPPCHGRAYWERPTALGWTPIESAPWLLLVILTQNKQELNWELHCNSS